MKKFITVISMAISVIAFVCAPSGAAAASEPQVIARWAEEALAGYSAYDVFIADTSEWQVKIVFSAEGGVRDFKVLKLDIEDIDENGKPTFSAVELYARSRLAPERPLVLGMTFWGSIPHYGISYVDESGTTRNYYIDMSGEDGSLYLEEF
jgi:hypothetical protein